MATSKNLLGKTKRRLKVVTLRLYEEDIEDAKDYFPAIGYNVVLRDVFAAFMANARSHRQKEIEKNVDLGSIDFGALDSVGGSPEGGGTDTDPEGTV